MTGERRYPYGVRPPWAGYKYRPMFKESPKEKTLAEVFLEKVEEEGDVEEAYQKSLRIGLRRPGTEKKRVEAYLRRALEVAQEEGRI